MAQVKPTNAWQRPDFVKGIQGSLYGLNMGAMTRVEELGNWRAVSTYIETLPKNTKKAVYAALLFYGKSYQKKLKEVIKGNGALIGGWKALNPKYQARKKQNKDNIYRYSGALYKGIIVKSNLTMGQVIVTVDQNAGLLSKGKMSISQVAKVLESGSIKGKHNIPARPLFKPTWRHMGGNTTLRAVVSEAIILTLRKTAPHG